MNIGLSQNLAWDPVTDALAYDVELLNAAGGTVLNSFTVDETFIAAFELLEGQNPGTFTCHVRAVSGSFEGPWSDLLEISFAPLAAPQNLRVE